MGLHRRADPGRGRGQPLRGPAGDHHAVVPPRDSGSFDADLTEFFAASFRSLADPGLARGLRDLASGAQHDEHVAEALAGFTARRRAALRAVLARGVDQGRLSPGADLDLLVDLGYGFLWYRLLVGHRPLDEAAAQDLAASLIAAGDLKARG
jgi:AcrR family transcriptional regulator